MSLSLRICHECSIPDQSDRKSTTLNSSPSEGKVVCGNIIASSIELFASSISSSDTAIGATTVSSSSTSIPRQPSKVDLEANFADDSSESLDLQDNVSAALIHYAIMLGVPREMSVENLMLYLEPYLHNILSLDLVSLAPKKNASISSATAFSSNPFISRSNNILLFSFLSNDDLQSFITVYNNLHFPFIDDIAPCIVVKLDHLEIITNAESAQAEYREDSTTVTPIPLSISMQQPEKQPPYFQIPTCTVCIRRIRSTVTSIDCSLPDSLWHRTNLGRCYACAIYNNVSNSILSESSSDTYLNHTEAELVFLKKHKKRCETCGLEGNIWVCLICGHNGCGRYSAQHAKKHFEESRHPFTLELATGRIWDYAHDLFAHEEINNSNTGSNLGYSYTSNATTSHSLGGNSNEVGDRVQSLGDPNMHSLREESFPSKGKAGGVTTHRSLVSGVSDTECNDTSEATTIDRVNSLDPTTHRKLDSMVQYYEALLETQLRDQELYYEKMLAKETVRALETNHRSMNQKDDLTYAAVIGDNVKTSSSFYRDAKEEEECFASEEEMNMMESLKLEISAIEIRYLEILEAVKNAEQNGRTMRKQNDMLIREQKIHRDVEAALIKQEEDVRIKCREQVAEFEQQMTELKFYARTQKSFANSPYKDEIEGSQLLVTGNEPGNNSSSHSSNGTNNRGRGGRGSNKSRR